MKDDFETTIVRVNYAEKNGRAWINSYLTEGSNIKEKFSAMEAACACLVVYENFASLVDEHEEIEFEKEFKKYFDTLFLTKNEDVEPVKPPDEEF